jgi:hypothetical protein
VKSVWNIVANRASSYRNFKVNSSSASQKEVIFIDLHLEGAIVTFRLVSASLLSGDVTWLHA